jgi:hypothetical protein
VGGFSAFANTSDYIVADGIHLRAKRRDYTRGPERRADLGHADGLHRHQRRPFHVTDLISDDLARFAGLYWRRRHMWLK